MHIDDNADFQSSGWRSKKRQCRKWWRSGVIRSQGKVALQHSIGCIHQDVAMPKLLNVDPLQRKIGMEFDLDFIPFSITEQKPLFFSISLSFFFFILSDMAAVQIFYFFENRIKESSNGMLGFKKSR